MMSVTLLIVVATIAVSVLCFRSPRLFNALSLNPYRIVKDRQWYRIFTHGFVHADMMHLLVNMLVLLSFGQYVERIIGDLNRQDMIGNGMFNYLLLYFGGMAFATIQDIVRQKNNPSYTSIGASGAVSAVVFASIFFNPWGMIYFFGILPIPGLLFGILYLFYSQYMSRRDSDNINHTAHIYGAVYGFLFPLLMKPSLIHDFFNHLWFR